MSTQRPVLALVLLLVAALGGVFLVRLVFFRDADEGPPTAGPKLTSTKPIVSEAPIAEHSLEPLGTGLSPGGVAMGVDGHSSMVLKIEAEDYNPGGEGVGFHDEDRNISRGLYRDDDVGIISPFPGTYSVGHMYTGEWVAYTVKIAASGTYDIDLYVATAQRDRLLRLDCDGERLTELTPVPSTGGWDAYQVITAPAVKLTSGTHTLKIVFEKGRVNLDWFKIVPITGGVGLDAETLTVQTLWDLTGEPAAKATVSVGGERPNRTRWRFTGQTDDGGQVALKFPRSSLGAWGRLWASHQRAKRAVIQEVSLSQPAADLIQLEHTTTLYGTVTLAPSMAGSVEGARIQLVGAKAETRAAKDGSFELTHLTETAARLSATQGRLCSQEVEPVELIAGRRNGPVTLVLDEGSEFSGRVTDKATGQPITGAKVIACQRSGSARQRLTAITDSAGAYRLAELGLFPGAFDVEVEANGYALKWAFHQRASDRSGAGDFALAPKAPLDPAVAVIDGDGLPRLTDTSDNAADVAPGGVRSVLGRRIEVEDYDFGGEGVAYHDATRGNRWGKYRDEDVDVESRRQGQLHVSVERSNEWLNYTVYVPATGRYDLDFCFSSRDGGQYLHFDLDDAPWSESIHIPSSKSWDVFPVVTAPNLPLTKDRHTLKLFFDKGWMNADWFRLVPLTGP